MKRAWLVVAAALLFTGAGLAGCKCSSCEEGTAKTASACAFCKKTGVACKACASGEACAKCTECAKCPDCTADKACDKCMAYAKENLTK